MRNTYLFLFFVEFVIVAGKALHRDEQVSKGGLEVVPLIGVVEEVQDKSLDLHFIQVGEERVYAVYE